MYLNYHHLRCFAAVVEEGGVKAAAARLSVSHPTVSEQLRALEAQLELTLFSRRGRRLQLTDDGRAIYEYAARIFAVGAELVEAAQGRRSGQTVFARIGVDSVLAKLRVRRLVSPLMETFGAALQLRCVEREREALFAALLGRHLDVVLTDAAAHVWAGTALRSYRLLTTTTTFFVHPDAAPAGDFPRCLDGAPFLWPLAGTRLRRELERWMAARKVQPRVTAEIEDSALVKAFGQDARGVFAMPSDLRREVCEQYGVVALGTADEIELRTFAITRNEPVESAAVRELLAVHGHDPAADA